MTAFPLFSLFAVILMLVLLPILFGEPPGDEPQQTASEPRQTAGLLMIAMIVGELVSTDVRTWTLSAIENWTPGLSDSAPRFSRGGLSR